MKKSPSLLNLLGVFTVSLCWGVGGPLSWVVTQSLPAAETAWGRCTFAFLGLFPFFVLDQRKIMKSLNYNGKFLLVSSGLVLGIHFFLFVSGVAYASLATAVTLVAVEPALILLVGVLGFKERLRLESFFGILLCILGIIIISILPHLLNGSTSSQPEKAYGDICAVLAVISYGAYYALNRAFRSHERSLPHLSPLRRGFSLASIIYFFAAISSGLIALISHLRGKEIMIAPSFRVLVSLIAMGLIPTMLGHTLNQIVSRTAHPIWVSLMSPGETLMAILLGYVFLGQKLGSFEVVGGFFILGGVLLAIRSEAQAD